MKKKSKPIPPLYLWLAAGASVLCYFLVIFFTAPK